MRDRIQPSAITFLGRVVLPVALFASSCRTVPPKVETPQKPQQSSPATERYKKKVEDRLGPIWYRLVKINEDSLGLGTVTVTFAIPPAAGRVHDLKVTSNTGGRMDELVARGACLQLRAPPVPPEIAAQMPDGYFHMEESFSVFDKAYPPPSPTPKKK